MTELYDTLLAAIGVTLGLMIVSFQVSILAGLLVAILTTALVGYALFATPISQQSVDSGQRLVDSQ